MTLVLTLQVNCSRAMGDAGSAISYFDESVEFLTKLPADDLEVILLALLCLC